MTCLVRLTNTVVLQGPALFLRPLAHQAAMDSTNGVLDISLQSPKDC
ncbi:MAG TPA: hypothetical protein VHE78_16590 [Gemmatimonadaceae bacterium]|nr:hypothetical protein [Gemmatimonadaceae bacterium]